MAVNGGGSNGVFAATINDQNSMMVVAITSSVNAGSGDGHLCQRLRRRLMVAVAMAILAVAALAVGGGGSNGGLR